MQKVLVRIESKVDGGAWGVPGPMLLDLAERETANSAEVLNHLLEETSRSLQDSDGLKATSLTQELVDISPELDQRLRGALFALDPQNPDAARHFCTSSREILGRVLETEAPDDEVLSLIPDAQRTERGNPTRRAKVRFFLLRKGFADEDLEEFIEEDLANVVSLFDVLNEGAHGSAGRFTLNQLVAVKRRVEDAIKFLYQIIR